jgi:hypothetical protein
LQSNRVNWAAYLPTQICPNFTVTALTIWLTLAAGGVCAGVQQDQQIDKTQLCQQSSRVASLFSAKHVVAQSGELLKYTQQLKAQEGVGKPSRFPSRS